MSGHSKWNNIKRKKEKTDGAKAKVFTKIGREISVAVRTGGPNPASNSKLADLIAKAKRMSVPNDNIQRIIKKAEGGDKTEYEAVSYTHLDVYKRQVFVYSPRSSSSARRAVSPVT